MSLNLFDVPEVDYRYEASRDLVFQPALTGIQPITFSIPASDDYYDLDELRFHVKVRLTDPADGYQELKANLAISDANNTRNTYCVNNFGHSLFRDMTLSMNGVLMTEQSNTYHYRAYLETLLNYNREEGATKLAPQGWVNQLNVVEELSTTTANTDVPNNTNWSGNTELRALTSRLLDQNWHTFIIRPHPYAFQKFGVTQVRQSLNGEEYPYRTLQLTGTEAYEDLLGYDRFLQAMGAYNENKIPMLLLSDWGQGKNCTLFLFNNVPSGKADDPQYRSPRQSRNVRLVIDFAAAVNHNIAVLVWSEYENVYEINHLGGIKYNING